MKAAKITEMERGGGEEAVSHGREETEQVLMMCRQAIQEKKTLKFCFENNRRRHR